MPRKGYTQLAEHRARIAASVSAARSGSSQSPETRERIAEAQRTTWAVRHAERARTIRSMAAKAKEPWKSEMLREAERLEARVTTRRSSGSA